MRAEPRLSSRHERISFRTLDSVEIDIKPRRKEMAFGDFFYGKDIGNGSSSKPREEVVIKKKLPVTIR